MTVLYSERTLPITPNASNTGFSASVNLAWDFTGVGAIPAGDPWIWDGTKPSLPVTGTINQATVAGEPCRVPAANALYDYTGAANYGWATSEDFTIAIRVATPSTLPAGSNYFTAFRLAGSSGQSLQLNMLENPGVGWYLSAQTSAQFPIGSAAGAIMYGVNTILTIWVRRVGGLTTIFTQNSTAKTDAVVRYPTSSAGPALDQTAWLTRTWTAFNPIVTGLGTVAIKRWSVAHSDATISAIGKDFWDSESNAAATQTISISSPTSGSTIQVQSVISGSYTGTPPTSIQVQHGAAGWITGTLATIGGNTWSATFLLAGNTANTLQARYGNTPAVVSATVANVTVNPDSINFTAPNATTCAQSYRIFQRNGSQQASVRITGTYTGTVTNLEWSWAGAPFTTLVAGPVGGTFDVTKTLTGPAQGDLVVRFSNNTAVNNTLFSVGVGDVYIVAGQSNHVGGGNGTYVPPVLPNGKPQWAASIYAKNGTWRPNVETAIQPFSDTTGAVYSVQAGSPTAQNSYFGKLATQIMAAGVPVAFVPSAMGSTAMNAWVPGTNVTTLYGAMVAAANTIGGHKAMLWWQGEADCSAGTTNTNHQIALNALVNDWFTRFGTKTVLMNLNVTGNAAGTGGSSGSDTGFNAIHAAIASVAAGNANVAGIADMNGTFSGSIHYSSGPEITAVSQAAFNVLNTLYYARSVTLNMVDASGVPLLNMTGINWSLFDNVTPNLFVAPSSKGSGAIINASGVLTITIPNTNILTGGTGWLIASDSDGTVGQSPAPRVFSGPVVVA